MNKNTIRNVALATTAGVIALAGSTFAADVTSTSTTAVQPTVRTKIAQWKDKIQNKKASMTPKKDTTNRTDTASSTNTTNQSQTDKETGNGRGGMMKGNKGGMHDMMMKGDRDNKGMHMGMKHKDPAVEAALKANDYNAFLTAWNADTHKPSDAKAPTQEQFTDMVTHYNKQQAKEAAIEKNDYNAFVAATTPTPAEFAKIVAQHATHKAINAALTANDYNAFLTAWNADTNKPSDAKAPTQAEFTKMATRHNDITTNAQK